MIRANSWTAEEEAWLREVYPWNFNDEIAEMHAERFPDRPRRTAKAVNSRAKVWHLRKADGFDRSGNTRRMRSTWTPERVEWLMSFAPGHDIYEIVDEFEHVFGIRLTKGAMKDAKHRFGARSGTDVGRFAKGQEPPNKGMTWDEIGLSERARANCRKGWFKKGHVPHNAADKPVGYERVGSDGYVYVKVAERPSRPDCNDNFALKHRLVYEREHGAIPDGCAIVFADHDTRNFDPRNLVAVPRDLWAGIMRSGLEYWDAESLGACMAVAKLNRVRYAAQCRPRACRKCGAEFAPRFPKQRTCDSCLGRERGTMEGGPR